MMRQNQVAQQLLATRYLRNTRPVAFVDESYRQPRGGDLGVYSMTAAVVDAQQLNQTRSELLAEVGDTWWHTTEVYNRGEHVRVQRALDWFRESDAVACLTVHTQSAEMAIESLRRQCLVQLFALLANREVRLVVLERRQTQQERNSDERVIRLAKSTELIDRSIDLVQTSPRFEPLLWVPDLVAWAAGRHLSLGEKDWVRGLAAKITVAHVGHHERSYQPLERKKPEPAVASGSGSELLAGFGSGGETRSSASIIANEAAVRQSRFQFYENLVEAPLVEDRLQSWLTKHF